MAKTTLNPHVAQYFCDSPCRTCGADRSWLNVLVRRYFVVGRKCTRCGHMEKALLSFPSYLANGPRAVSV